MHITGIVAEYNPFHSGHKFHIEAARKVSNADYVAVIMSPDFVQRGEPAIFDKFLRTKMALACGADLVLELPVCYACGSAEYFAEGAVSLLENVVGASSISFGCETPDAQAFSDFGSFFANEPAQYQQLLQNYLKQGYGFPAARQAAFVRLMQNTYSSPIRFSENSINIPQNFIETPNNILGIEYSKAIHRLGSQMQLIPIQRTGSNYHDAAPSDTFSSATAVRESLKKGLDLTSMIPAELRAYYKDGCAHPVYADDLLPLLYERLLCLESFSSWQDISGDLSDRIRKLRFACIGKSFEEIQTILSSKWMTNSRIRRALLHLILDIKKEDVQSFRDNGSVFYGRILGFKKEASPLLHHIRKSSSLPLISKMANAADQLDTVGQRMLQMDIAASHLYRSLACTKDHSPFQPEYLISPIVLSDI